MTTDTVTPEEYSFVIEEPISQDLFEPEIIADPIDRGFNTTWEERKEIKDACIKEGYEKRAIVVNRNIHTYWRDEPTHWGVIVDVVSYTYVNEERFAPIEVMWVNGNKGKYYPEELIICMYAPDDQDIAMIKRGE